MRDFWDKVEIVTKFVGSIALGIIPFVIGYYADSIKQSMERAKLVESLITELTDDQKQTRRDLALLALEAASPPQERCFLGIIGCRLVEPDLVIEVTKLLVRSTDSQASAIGFEILKRRNNKSALEVASDVRPISNLNPDALLQEKEVAGRATAAETIFPKVSSPPPSEASLKDIRLVFIQYQSNKDQAKRVQDVLAGAGISAPGVEQVAGIKQNDIRYSGTGDRDAAENLRKYLDSNHISIDAKNLVDLSKNYKVPRGQFEIWLKD